MVAQVSNETFAEAMAPSPDPSDSDDVSLALEAARVLERQGDISEAVRWLRRAADEAEKDGNDLRVVALARAAADLSSRSSPAPLSARLLSPPPLPVRASSPPSSSRPASKLPPPRPVAAGSSTPAPTPASPRSLERGVDDRGSIRVSVQRSALDTNLFVVRRLDPGQKVPVGATEAKLVFEG